MLPTTIPRRAETLQVLRLIDNLEPLLMLTGADDGYGSRWTLSGEQVQPAIARYLMESGFVAEIGRSEFGARKLGLTESGNDFLARGLRWWASLGWFEKLKITIFG